jgi:hypothetical protein
MKTEKQNSQETASDDRFPLGQFDAADAANNVSRALDEYPAAKRLMRKMLSARYVGATSLDDMQRILGEVHAEIRATLPDGGTGETTP